ncbi:MAG: response regulator, partial [Clostridiales Family XIII bacterium]|nr:response regulator [Clostridiales Family XIII bacterium]
MNSTGLLFLVSLVIFGVVIYFIGMLWFSDKRNRRHKGLFALGLSMSFWVLFSAIAMVSTETIYPLIYTLRMVAVAFNPYCALIFAREISGSAFLNKPAVVTLSLVLPIIDCLMILTNGLHHLYFESYTYPIAQLAPAFWVHYTLSIAVWVLAFTFLMGYFCKTIKNKYYIIILTAAAVMPILANILFTTPQLDIGHDIVPYAYFITFAIFAIFTNPAGAFNLQTGALSSIVDSSPDIYVVVDAQKVIVDGNIKKFEYFNQVDFVPGRTTIDDLIRFMQSRSAKSDAHQLLEINDPAKTFTEMEMTASQTLEDGSERYFTFTVTKKLMIHNNKYKGYVIIMSDVSEYRAMIDEINQQNQDLLAMKDTAEKASETKSTFLANMSHEMRTPLNAVIGLSELELGNESIEGEARDNLEKIYGAGMNLLSTINDILDISKIESGKFELLSVEYDMPSLINDTITLNIMRISEKPIDFKLHIDGNLPSKLFGDELRVKQVFNNLLSNAFKYTREGTVDWTLACERDGDDIWLVSTIRDSGIGIKKEDMVKLFTDYSQVDTKSNRAIEGTGLGLSITKQMVDMMDGEILAESEYMKGSVFTVRLKQGFVTDTPIGETIANNLMAFHYTEKKRDKSQKMLRVQLPYARVLVVDDVPTNLDVAKGMMKPYGMTVDCVTSGQKAIDLIRAAAMKYDAIFMDHMMPEMDGIEATKIIREKIGTEYAKHVPIIALTANAVVGTDKIFLQNGFQAFLSKPIDIIKMDEVITMWVRDKEREQMAVGGASGDSGGVRPADVSGGGGESGESGGVLETISINGIDLEKGLARFSYDEDAYLQTLRSYAASTPALIDRLRDFDKADLPNVAVTVHGIKGSSFAICADPIGKKAEELER